MEAVLFLSYKWERRFIYYLIIKIIDKGEGQDEPF